MKVKFIKLLLLITIILFSLIACSKVPAGYVGIKVYLLGNSKGVDQEELGVGKYWIGINEELYLFPTFTQNYVWTSDKTEGSERDESFNFQDIQGLELNADIGITYRINPDKVPVIFEKYKKGIEEITDVYLRNMVRDALVKRTSTLNVEYIYGEGRAELIENITIDVKELCSPIGIEVEKIYWIGRIKLPEVVKKAINAKIEATQRAMQRENELRETEAESKKKIAKAEGEAKSMILRAKAESEAMRLKSLYINYSLIKYEAIKKWDGKLPTYTGDSIPLIEVK